MHFLIVDDHPLYREALQSTVQRAFDGATTDEAASIAAACDSLTARRSTDLVLLDLSMESVSGFDGLITIRKRFPSIPIVVVSGLDEPRIVQEAIRFGAAGFVPKAAGKATLVASINSVLRGELGFPAEMRSAAGHDLPGAGRRKLLSDRLAQLTPQQMRVLAMIRQGKLNKQIAHELSVGDSTVKAHVSEILRKLGVMSRTQIVIETASLNF